jgi:hypothetical protein
MNDISVKVSYKNKKLEKVKDCTYDFSEYTEMIYFELMRVIMDIEDVFYRLEDSKAKDQWDEQNTVDFQKIRHKILDQANAIKRLPQNVFMKDVPMNEFIANILDNN